MFFKPEFEVTSLSYSFVPGYLPHIHEVDTLIKICFCLVNLGFRRSQLRTQKDRGKLLFLPYARGVCWIHNDASELAVTAPYETRSFPLDT